MNRERFDLRDVAQQVVTARGAPRLGLLLLIVGGLLALLYLAAWGSP
jgi:hypothetical protein